MSIVLLRLSLGRIVLCLVGVACCGWVAGCVPASLQSSRQQVGQWGLSSLPAGREAEKGEQAAKKPLAELVIPEPEPAQKTPVPVVPVKELDQDWQAKSDASLRHGDWTEAIRTASVRIRRDPKSLKAYLNRSFAYNQKKIFSLAVADATLVLYQDPLNVLALANRCYAWSRLGRLEEARADCQGAIDLAPEFSMPYTVLGFILEQEGKMRQASLYYEMGCGLNDREGCRNRDRLAPMLSRED